MALIGMVASGCGFLLLGLWQACISLGEPPPSSSPPRSQTPSPTVRKSSSAQMICTAALSFLHLVSGLVASHREKSLGDGIGYAVPLERSSVALVFLIFAIINLLRMHSSLLPLPREISCLVGLFAFGQELLLFHLQRPDAGLESRYYTLLLVPIGACMIALVASIVAPASLLPPLALAGGLLLQGTWLIQMGASFFTKSFMPVDCELRMRGDCDYVIDCGGSPMALMRGKALATLQFNCHMALLLLFLLPLYSILRRRYGLSSTEAFNYEMVSTADANNAKRHGDLQLQPPVVSVFSLELDEDMEDDKSVSDGHHHGANGISTPGI